MPLPGHRTSRRMPPRSATAPLPRGPPSPELSNLDCAFPPFPTTKSRSATPTGELESKQSRSNHTEYLRMHAEPSPLFAPRSPGRSGGGRVLQRMNTIAPGPFDVESRDQRDRSQGPGTKQHKRTATASSSKDFPHPPTFDPARFDFPRPSTANPNVPRKPSLASISGGPRSVLDREERKLSSEPPLPRIEKSLGDGQYPHQAPPPLPLGPETRSQTFPMGAHARGDVDERAGSQSQRSSESSSSSRSRRPTVSANSRPPMPKNVISQDVPFRPPPEKTSTHGSDRPAIHLRSPSRDKARTDTSPEAAPSIQVPTRANVTSDGSSYHTPTDSVSSSGSYGSDARSGSSRSSPPLSDASARPRAKPLNINQVGNSWMNFQSSTDSLSLKEPGESNGNDVPRSSDESMYLRPMDTVPHRDARMDPPESPMDPAMQRGRLSPFPPISTQASSAAAIKSPTLAPPPARRRAASNKGNCRGCSELIIGKSVSSADGRLTGRYHKRCFVCKTCLQTFKTADFYILNDQPYCERHYHELNDSLCRACDRGIEGQYLATESKQKFHPQCFTCQVRTACRSIKTHEPGTNRPSRIAA